MTMMAFMSVVSHTPIPPKTLAPLRAVHHVAHASHDPHLALAALMIAACVVMFYVIHHDDRRPRSLDSPS